MKRICMDCGKYMGEAKGPADLETHGLCDSCFETRMNDMRGKRSEQLKDAFCAAVEQFSNTFNLSGRVMQDILRCLLQAMSVTALAISSACMSLDGWLEADRRRNEMAGLATYSGGANEQ